MVRITDWVVMATRLSLGLMLCGAASALTVRLTEPLMNAEVTAATGIAVAAAADGAVTRVEFLDGDQVIGSASQPPYRMTYRPTANRPNFRLTARATDAAGLAVASAPVTCVAKRGVPRQYQFYDFAETAEGMNKQVRLAIPEGLGLVRGILVVSNPAGGDTRAWCRQGWYGEFARLHGFAFLGTSGFTSHTESLLVMQHALTQFAAQSGHSELVNVPYATTGFSAGGGFASRLALEVPERVIAAAIVSSRLNLQRPASAALLDTPVCTISGELEKLGEVVAPVLSAGRKQGARWGWMTVQGGGHSMTGQEVLAMPLLDAAVRLRYPATAEPRRGPVALAPIPLDAGWLADNGSWRSGLTTIAPAAGFKGNTAATSWLPSADIAFIYRAYATYDRPLSITSPQPAQSRDRVWAPGSDVTITVDDSRFVPWRTLAFYDGAAKLGEIRGGPAQWTATGLTPGLHVFSVLGADAQGRQWTSDPVLVIVCQPQADGT